MTEASQDAGVVSTEAHSKSQRCERNRDRGDVGDLGFNPADVICGCLRAID